MSPDDLTAFLCLAKELHFGRAAEALHLSTSNLSRRLQTWEQSLGRRLLIRDRRQVSLTKAGLRLQDFAQDILRRWQEFHTLLQEEEVHPSGHLSIACTVTASHHILSAPLAQCRQDYPGIAIAIRACDAEQAKQELFQDRVDIAVIPLPRHLDKAYRWLSLIHTSLVFIAPRESGPLTQALRQEKWQDIPMILQRSGRERQELDNWCQRHNIERRIYAEVNDNEALIAMIAMGCGIGLVPQLVIESSPLAPHVQVLDSSLDAPPGYEVGLCIHSRRFQHRHCAAFWELAAQTAWHASRQ